jgi:hypothetical protein
MIMITWLFMTALVVIAQHQMTEQLWMIRVVKNVAVIHCDQFYITIQQPYCTE